MAGITGVAGSAAASANMMASTEYRVFDFRDMFYCPISMQVMVDPVSTVDGFTYERQLIEEWLQKHDIGPSSGAHLSSKKLTPNVALRAAIQEWEQILRVKADIEDRQRQLIEMQHLVLQREHTLHEFIHAQRTIQIAQARQEADKCADLKHASGSIHEEFEEAGVGAQTKTYELIHATEKRRQAEEEHRRNQEVRMQKMRAAADEERKREYAERERELQEQLKALEAEHQQRRLEEKAAEEQRRKEKEAQKQAAALEKKMRSEEKRLKKEEKERMRLQRKERMRGQEERQREAAAGQAKDDGRVSLDHAHANPTPAGKAKSAKGKSGNGHAVTSAVASWRKQGGGNISEAVARSCRALLAHSMSLACVIGRTIASLGYVSVAYVVYMVYEFIDIVTGVHPLWERMKRSNASRCLSSAPLATSLRSAAATTSSTEVASIRAIREAVRAEAVHSNGVASIRAVREAVRAEAVRSTS